MDERLPPCDSNEDYDYDFFNEIYSFCLQMVTYDLFSIYHCLVFSRSVRVRCAICVLQDIEKSL